MNLGTRHKGWRLQILQEPPQPGWLRVCPACGKWFALEYQRSEPDPVCKQIRFYRCTKCGEEIEFARTLPTEVV